MNSCARCIELENYFDRQLMILRYELKKKEDALEEQEWEIIRLRNLVKWFTDRSDTPQSDE